MIQGHISGIVTEPPFICSDSDEPFLVKVLVSVENIEYSDAVAIMLTDPWAERALKLRVGERITVVIDKLAVGVGVRANGRVMARVVALARRLIEPRKNIRHLNHCTCLH